MVVAVEGVMVVLVFIVVLEVRGRRSEVGGRRSERAGVREADERGQRERGER